MSMPRSRRIHTELLFALVALLAVGGTAQAKKSDKNQPIHINANAFAGSQDSGHITFTGKVEMNQGSFHADGDQATGYTDPNDHSQWQRIVLTGTPAHFSQTQDNGTLVHGQAETLNYKVSENTVILIGHATVVQQGKGQFHGDKLTYNTDTGRMVGSASTGGRVHITLQPRTKPAPAPAPASSIAPAPATTSASASPAASASSAPAVPFPATATSTATPAAPTSTAPVPAAASSTGTH